MLVAGADIDIEDQTRRSHRIRVIAMARTPRLLGIVAENRPFLVAVKRLDRRIDVEDPRLGQQRLHTILQVSAQPDGPFRLVDRLEGAPDRVLADDLLHPEEVRQNRVAAQRRNVRVAPVAGEHGKHRRAENVPLARRVRTHIAQRTVGHEGVEQSGRLEEVDEERQLTKRRHRRLLVPFNPDRAEKAVQVNPLQPRCHNQRLLTRPVSPRRRRVALHALENARFSPSRQNQTAVSRFNDDLRALGVPGLRASVADQLVSHDVVRFLAGPTSDR